MAPKQNPFMHINAMRISRFLLQGTPKVVTATKRLKAVNAASFN